MSGPFAQQNPWGAPQQLQGIGNTTLPFGNFPPTQLTGYGTSLAQPLQQVVQSLLVLPQQLQQLLQVAQIQQHQVQYLLQSIPQQLQQLQQQLLGQPGFQSFAPHHGLGIPQIPFSGAQPFGAQPFGVQPFGAQPGYLM